MFNYTGFDWLKNKETNYKLEIDIWVPEFKLAIEYNGRQHYYPVQFGGTLEEAEFKLVRSKKLDKIKDNLIKQHNDIIETFIIFKFNEKITIDNVKKKLKKYKVII